MRYLTLILSLILVFPCLKASCQYRTELRPGYYVVVGAYGPTRENVAQNYTEVLNRRGFNAGYGFNSSRKYFFVYLKYFHNLKESLVDMLNTRKQEEFSKAWVRVIPGDIASTENESVQKVAQKPGTPGAEVPSLSGKGAGMSPDSQEQKPFITASLSRPIDDTEITYNPEIKQYAQMTLGNTEVFLSLYNANNNRIVDGTVTVVDTERSRSLKEVKGNEYLILPDPKSKSGQLTLICEAFGYRKIQHEINYAIPLADTVKDFIDLMGTTIVVNFDLVQYQKGDIGTFFHVYFYNAAAILLPESKYELNNLLQMLQENPDYRIRLHGHTNGNYHGRILTMGANKNLFSLEGAKSGRGSAKDLSYHRAAIIKEFLGEQGINPSRIEVTAWGGKRPIYDKHSVNAKKNVRVEVEILQE